MLKPAPIKSVAKTGESQEIEGLAVHPNPVIGLAWKKRENFKRIIRTKKPNCEKKTADSHRCQSGFRDWFPMGCVGDSGVSRLIPKINDCCETDANEESNEG